ncbi:MAG: TetR family transcriptional regulator C-terminal domain-containing protein [Bacteroidota bacterium]
MKQETVDRILTVGTELLIKNGYNSVGLNRILESANIPKGSFYYFFKSKEDFGLKVLDFYARQNLDFLKTFLENKEQEPRDRIFDLLNSIQAIYEEQDYLQGCLLGNSSLELAAQKESFANQIAHGLGQWQNLFAKTIAEGQEAGSINIEFSADQYAEFLINSWEGALVRMKTTRSNAPMELFILFLEKLL